MLIKSINPYRAHAKNPMHITAIPIARATTHPGSSGVDFFILSCSHPAMASQLAMTASTSHDDSLVCCSVASLNPYPPPMTTTNYKHPTPHCQLHTSACPQATTPDYPGWVTPQPLEHHQRVTTCWCVVLLPWPPSLLRTLPMSHDNSLVCCSRVHDNPLSATDTANKLQCLVAVMFCSLGC